MARVARLLEMVPPLLRISGDAARVFGSSRPSWLSLYHWLLTSLRTLGAVPRRILCLALKTRSALCGIMIHSRQHSVSEMMRRQQSRGSLDAKLLKT
jgi:hypothetical protein